jgi:hypothetical protein
VGESNVRLFMAVRRGDLAAVTDLLNRHPDLANAEEAWSAAEAHETRMPYAGGATALVRAAEREDAAIVRLLVQRGADVRHQTQSALWVAVAAGCAEIVRYLAERGAPVDAVRPETGHAALHVAAMRGRSDLVELLLRFGADPGRRDAAGRTPLDWAKQNDHHSAVALLQAAPGRAAAATPVAPAAAGRPGRGPLLRHPGEGRLTAAVMTHPRRLAAAERLRDRHPELDLLLAVDPQPGHRPSALRSARVAWAAVGRKASHHLVLQDDVDLCPGFLGRVESAIAVAPTGALAFFSPWGSRTASVLRLAALLGSCWAEVVDPFVPTQALVLPAEIAAGFDAFAEREAGDDPADDTVMRAYLTSLGVPSIVSVPNLVEHDDAAPSLTGNDVWGPRRSACCAPAALPPAEWTGEVTRPTLIPFMEWKTDLALSDVRRTAGEQEWQRLRTDRLLSFRGLSDEVVERALAETLDQLERGRVSEAAVGGRRLRALWLTAVALGVSLAELWSERRGAGSIEDVLAGPAASVALSTMAPGALLRLCGADVLARCADALADVVRSGVRLGFTRTAPS